MKILLSEIQGYILKEMIIVTLFYGLRRLEALGLRWSAVDFEQHEVHINHTVVKVKEKIAKDTTKTEASYRTYSLPDYIFTWQGGRPFFLDYVTKAFKKIKEIQK